MRQDPALKTVLQLAAALRGVLSNHERPSQQDLERAEKSGEVGSYAANYLKAQRALAAASEYIADASSEAVGILPGGRDIITEIKDWRAEESPDQFASLTTAQQQPWRLEVSSNGNNLWVTLKDPNAAVDEADRTIAIEIENGSPKICLYSGDEVDVIAHIQPDRVICESGYANHESRLDGAAFDSAGCQPLSATALREAVNRIDAEEQQYDPVPTPA